MKSLLILNRLRKISSDDMVYINLTPVSSRLEFWLKNQRWPENINLPFPKMVFGFNLQCLKVRAAPRLGNSGISCLQHAFVVTRFEGGLKARGLSLVAGFGGLATVEPSVEFSKGEIRPLRKTADSSIGKPANLQWVKYCFGLLVMLENGQFCLSRDPKRPSFYLVQRT